jgi:hypothetical protein
MCQPCHFAYDGVRQKQIATMSPEARSAAARKMWAKRSPEVRAAIYVKSLETKRRNRELASLAAEMD